jgi:hypothetical protein
VYFHGTKNDHGKMWGDFHFLGRLGTIGEKGLDMCLLGNDVPLLEEFIAATLAKSAGVIDVVPCRLSSCAFLLNR